MTKKEKKLIVKASLQGLEDRLKIKKIKRLAASRLMKDYNLKISQGILEVTPFERSFRGPSAAAAARPPSGAVK